MPDPSKTPTAQELVESIRPAFVRNPDRRRYEKRLAALQARAEQADRLRDALERIAKGKNPYTYTGIARDALAASEETQP